MWRFLIVLFVLALFSETANGSQHVVCPYGEKYGCSKHCERKCEDGNIFKTCTLKCVPGCVCKEGLVRRQDGRCVVPKDCTVEHVLCPYGEKYHCSKHCERKCEDRNIFKACTLKCVPGCVCTEGLVRRQDGRCVVPIDCAE